MRLLSFGKPLIEPSASLIPKTRTGIFDIQDQWSDCSDPDCSVWFRDILRKEVIQPQVPLRLPCYDFTPVADPTVVGCLLAVGAPASGKTNSHGVTGGVYKARERIHRGMLIHDY
jgi:hypothetical protein